MVITILAMYVSFFKFIFEGEEGQREGDRESEAASALSAESPMVGGLELS